LNFKVLIDIARSLLLARFKQTLVAAIGVMFGITMFIGLLSFMSGLNELLDGMVMNRTPHIKLYNEIKPSRLQPVEIAEKNNKQYELIHSIKPNGGRLELHNNSAIMNYLERDPRVIGIAPKITTQVFFTIGSIELANVINGIDVIQESLLFNFSDYIVEGNYKDLNKIPNSIIIGKGAEEIDKVQSYVALNTTQKIIGKTESYITDIQLKLLDIDQAPGIAIEYAKLFDVDAEDIQTANSQFETGSSIRTLISYSVGITLLIVAGFGIYNILNMMIYEKMDTIAILKATGFSGSDVKSIFMLVALTIGVLGSLSGLILGFLLSAAIDMIPFNTAALPTIETYPVDYNPLFYIIGFSFGIITTYLAGSLPAQKASKIDPVLIIRGK